VTVPPFDYLLARFDPSVAVLIDSLVDSQTTLDLLLFSTANPAIVATAEDFARYLGRPAAEVRGSLDHLCDAGCFEVLGARRPLYLLTRNRQRRQEMLWFATQLADPRARRDVRKWLSLHGLQVLEGGSRAGLRLLRSSPRNGPRGSPPEAG
jgi:hypothetical protein